MAGLVRKTSIQFGAAGPSTAFGQFGSKVASAPQTSQDPAIIQGLAAWGQGWQNAIVAGDKAAYLQDMNGFCLVDSYQITYLLQMGIPEYDTTGATLYFTGSIVQTAASGQWFRSLQGGVPGVGAGQSGNVPPVGASNAFWQWLNPPTPVDGGLTVNAIPKASTTAPATLVNSLLSEVGGNVVLASGGIKFPDNSVQITAAVSSNITTVQSPPSAYIVTPTRTIGSTYQNTGSKPMFVLISVGQANPATTSVYVDSSATPSTLIASIGIGTGNVPGIFLSGTAFFIVLPGFYYRAAGGALIAWTEWT